MESRRMKIKDYVTHERVPVRGDSHGNFTLSPLGFPFVNRSGYSNGSTRPPTTFRADMLVHPDLTDAESASVPFLEYRGSFGFPRADAGHDAFLVSAILTVGSSGYVISSEQASFYTGCHVSVDVDDGEYEAISGDYTLADTDYIEAEHPLVLPDEGVRCTVNFRPELTTTSAERPLFIKFTGSGTNNGVYKLVVSNDANTGIMSYKWMYKTSIEQVACEPPTDVVFDGTENDNVHEHYRNRFSDAEVSDYLRRSIGPAIECGKFIGSEHPAEYNGLLVKWFLGKGAVVHSVAGKTVVLDGFGRVIAENGSTPDARNRLGDDTGKTPVYGTLHSWRMTTAGDNAYEDYPSNELSGDGNNITIAVERSGERHTFVVGQDLSDMVANPPRKTFIHLPSGLDVADGTEVELNVALPVVSQPSDVGESEDDVKAAIKSYADYVSQPRVYILSGKQETLPNNSVRNGGISTTESSFTLATRHPVDVKGSAVAFGLYNRYESKSVVRCTGDVNVVEMHDGEFVDDGHYVVKFVDLVLPASKPGMKLSLAAGDYLLLKYDIKTILSAKVVSTETPSYQKAPEAEMTVDFGRRLRTPYGKSVCEVHYDAVDCGATPVEGDAPLYRMAIPGSLSGVNVGDVVEFEVVEANEEEKLLAKTPSVGDDVNVVFSTPLSGNPCSGIHGFATSITVEGKTFPYNRSSRKWKMYSKDATCLVDVRTVGEQDGLSEHTKASGAFSNGTSAEPNLIDDDSIVATIYPTSANTFPWRLNGRNRIRHLGLTTNANVDYPYGDGSKPLTRLVFDMNERVYEGLSKLRGGVRPLSELRYGEENDAGSDNRSVIGSLLRVVLPEAIDADVEESDRNDMHVVQRATTAFRNLVGDFKVSRVGYESSRDWENKKNTSWGYLGDRPDPCPTPSMQGDDNIHRLNDWETKILHLPNCCMGVDETLERSLAYSGWTEYTSTANFRIFYDGAIDPFVDSNGYGDVAVGNVRYYGGKDSAGTTQRTMDTYSDSVEDDLPFDYTREHSVLKMFLRDEKERAANRYVTFVHGLLDLPVIKRGLRSISWLTGQESEFSNRNMEPFYPSSHVLSTDGVAFPDVNRSSIRAIAETTDDDVKRALLAFPDKVAICNDATTKNLGTELISTNVPNQDTSHAVEYMKSLLVMYSNGMPLHMYDAHRAINADSPTGTEGYLIAAHEIVLYNRNATGTMREQHRYCDLASNTTPGQQTEDVNMTYNMVGADAGDPDTVPVSLTSPLENVSSEFVSSVFGSTIDKDGVSHVGMYTRVHVSAMFSSSLGRWIVKDYRQYPTCFLTPLYGANTIDYREKSYSRGNPAEYENRVQMEDGLEYGEFSVDKYVAACELQPLWQLPCGVGTDYKSAIYTRYANQPPMDMNPGCVPFLMDKFPYGDDGRLGDSVKFRDLYESVSVPMDANGDAKPGSVPEVNFWNIKLHVRPARSAYPLSDVPSNSARVGGSMGEPTLGMFNDLA